MGYTYSVDLYQSIFSLEIVLFYRSTFEKKYRPKQTNWLDHYQQLIVLDLSFLKYYMYSLDPDQFAFSLDF